MRYIEVLMTEPKREYRHVIPSATEPNDRMGLAILDTVEIRIQLAIAERLERIAEALEKLAAEPPGRKV